MGQQFELVLNSEQFCWCHLGSGVLCMCYSFYTLADQRKPCHIVPNLDNLFHVLWTVPVVETSSYFPSERDVSFPSTPLVCKRVLKAATCCISLLGLPSKMLQGFPCGAVVENLPANAGDTGSSPGLGRSHMPRSN